MTSPSSFDRSALPPARSFYEKELGRLSRASNGWARTACPFHQGSNKTAFSVNVDSGGFYCFNCGVKGGDLVDYIQLRQKVDFKRAAQLLGAWRDISPVEKRALRQIRRKREELDSAVVSFEQEERDLRFQYRNEIHSLERQELAETLPRLREAIAAYFLLSFGTVADRITFTLHPDTRASAIQAVMLRGTVRDDHGIVTEVDFPAGGPHSDVRGLELTFP